MNFDVSTINVWEVEEQNGVDFSLLHFPAIWLGFWKYFCKDQPYLYLSIGSLMLLSVYIYPHQDIASFHPTSKDSLCGAQCREMEACTCVTFIAKIKQWIHEDDKSQKLIKIVHICGRWMMEWNTPFMSLSLLYLDNIRTWLYYCISFFFFLDLCVRFFWGQASWACHLSLSLFFYSPCLIWRILERERDH